MNRDCDFLVIGAGAGGATVARELAKRGKSVLIVEKGKREPKVGTFLNCLKYYDSGPLKIPLKSKEGVILWRTFMAGGTTVVSCGNSVRSLEKELADRGIHLEDEFAEAEKETGTAPIAEKLLSDASRTIEQAARDLGYKMSKMPKFINAEKCKKCGMCTLGCSNGAKWTGLDYLDEAFKNNVDILYSTQVEQILRTNGSVRGVSVAGPQGRSEISAKAVVLSAGALGTPVILQKAGIREAGSGLFVDIFVNTYGVTSGLNQAHEPNMAIVNLDFHKTRGFILSPHINASAMVRAIEIGPKGVAMPVNRLLGIMTKITDDAVGQVHPDGSISKPVTANDQAKLNEGSAIAKEILVKAGADKNSLIISKPQGAHPGGTAAIGKVVDENLQTKIDGLFVCDASVLPATPGLPPILTIIALGKRLAKKLAA
ncbi:MAG TPA: FAD-dependent oxidoreductase [Nitrospirota bacterium]|nr:FAD-dependent oxidoreductase [Nitrospirota bacterium]